MEHRQHLRIPTEKMVKLVMNGRVEGVSRTMEVSSGGARIYNPNLNLKCNDIVDIDFVRSDYPKGRNEPVRSMVVHVDPSSVGLMFESEIPLNNLMPSSQFKTMSDKQLKVRNESS